MALLNRGVRIGAMKSVRSWSMAGLILKMSFVLLRFMAFIVLVMMSVVVCVSWNGGCSSSISSVGGCCCCGID